MIIELPGINIDNSIIGAINTDHIVFMRIRKSESESQIHSDDYELEIQTNEQNTEGNRLVVSFGSYERARHIFKEIIEASKK